MVVSGILPARLSKVTRYDKEQHESVLERSGTMHNFTYYNPTKVHFGRGVINTLGDELNALGARKVLLVYGRDSIKRSGLYEMVCRQFEDAGIDWVEHGGARGNPVLTHARAGIELARRAGVDAICAVGGGSVIDEAKAISIGVPATEDVWEFFAGRAQPDRVMPLVTVLTLPATGSETNGISVLTNEQTLEKVALVRHGLLNPRVSFLDPEITFTLSIAQTAIAGVDIISHMTEGYFTTTDRQAIVPDNLLEGVIRAVMTAMDGIQKDPRDYNARAAFMWSASLAWCGLLQAGLGGWGMPCHALEMPMSAVYDMAHGAGMAVITPAWIELAGGRHEHRIRLFAERIFALKTDNLNDVANRFREFYRSIGAPTTFAAAGVVDPDIGRLAKLALESFNHRGVTGYDLDLIEAIYRRSLTD
jgi:hypothetical protein